MAEIPRLLPDEPFPPYAFVPGQQPHPVSDPTGHSHGLAKAVVVAPDPACWQSCQPYLYGLDLFNHGYYWEAHEAWEGLWLACGRQGTTATFLKGLIQLAVAGVKVRQGQGEGVRSHARRAGELFALVADSLGARQGHYLGLALAEQIEWASTAAELPILGAVAPGAAVARVFPFVLVPVGEAAADDGAQPRSG
jgi:predicted metal-dependent hydrolase